MIADILPDPQGFQSIGWIVVILFSLIGGTNQVMKLTDRFKPQSAQTQNIQPQPLIVSKAEEMVELRTFDEFVQQNGDVHRELFSKIGGVERGTNARMETLRLEIKADIQGVQNRLNAVAEEMPRRVLDLLHSTGALKS